MAAGCTGRGTASETFAACAAVAGRTALLVYTALDRFVDCCGPHRPWVIVPAEKLDEIDRLHGYDVIILDLEVPEELREGPAEASPPPS